MTTVDAPQIGPLVPVGDALTDVLPNDDFNVRGVPKRPWRDELRRIENGRNVITVIGCWLQSFGVVIAAAVIHTWWSYLLAFVLMARGHVCLNILAHESAHRLLFSKRWANDHIGRWLIGYPTLQPTLNYRRAHFAHHRDEMGPEEPDMNLYVGYPIPADSWRRKLRRDITGQTGWKRIKQIGAVLRKGPRNGGTEAWQMIAVQAVMLGVSIAFMRPLAYLVWIASWMTLWQFTNRLRAIAEHGGMIRSRDRRQTTHVIRQSRLARFWIVPYNTGWHLAHHVDMGVTWRNLPELHDGLVEAGWITPDIEYPSYRAFWRTLTR